MFASAISPFKGSDSVSAYVALATRYAMMMRYHDAVTDPCLRKDLRIDREVLGPALLRRVLGSGDTADVATVRQAIWVLEFACPEAEPPHAGTRSEGAV